MPTVLGAATVDGVSLTTGATYVLNPVTGEIVEFSNFQQSGAPAKCGMILPNKNIASGRIYRMKPGTSTVGPEVNAIPSGSSNLYNLLAVGGLGESTRAAGIEQAGFTVEGTQQGHSYGGLKVRYSLAAYIHDLIVKGIPGTSSTPPGETFSLELWHADGGAIVEDVFVDGMDIAATLFGLNTCSDVTVRSCIASRTKVGFGIAIWQCANVLIQDFDSHRCHRAINIEQPQSPHTLEQCDVRGTNRPHITCNSTERSIPLKVIDPAWDTGTQLRIGVSSQPYFGKPQLQKISDVQVIKGGVDISKDTSKVLIGDVW